MPGATTVRPSGFSSSLATLAMNFELPMPTDAVSPPVTSVTRRRSSSANALTVATSWSGRSERARSTKASSRDSGSTSGETSARRVITAWLASR